MDKYSVVFKDVADFLNEENWIKGEMFAIKNGYLCFDVYGAVKARTVPALISILETGIAAGTSMAQIVYRSSYFNDPCLGAPSKGQELLDQFGTCEKAWEARDPWIRTNYICAGVDRGNNDPGFILGMAGLTSQFHDAPATTLEMVKEKLLLASRMAERLGM